MFSRARDDASMTRVVVEELLPGTAVAEPGALERAIRAVCRGTMLRVQVPRRVVANLTRSKNATNGVS